MFKKIILSGLILFFVAACGWLSLPLVEINPPPAGTPAPAGVETAIPQPTQTLRMPSRNTPTPAAPEALATAPAPVAELPVVAPEAVQVDEPQYVVQPGTPAQVTNFIAPDAGCSYMGIAGQVFDLGGQPVTGLIIEVSGELEGNTVLQLGLSGGATKLGPGGYEIKLADRAIASQQTLAIQVFDLAGLALSDQIYFDTSSACDANLTLLNFTALVVEYDEKLYFPYTPNN